MEPKKWHSITLRELVTRAMQQDPGAMDEPVQIILHQYNKLNVAFLPVVSTLMVERGHCINISVCLPDNMHTVERKVKP